jgi:pilus assembly protein Flp/PilA
MLSNWIRWTLELYKNEDGPTAVEYAVMLALIIIVCLTAITTLGNNANSTFKTVGTKLGSASS